MLAEIFMLKAEATARESKESRPSGAGLVYVSGCQQSIVLRCRVTPPFAELRQMLLVDAIDLGLHIGMPTFEYYREFADQSSRAKPFK